jgi:hypothetical protein
MKIIGEQGNGQFIATVSRTELEKFYDNLHGRPGKELALPLTKIGCEYDLSAGYDFRRDVQQACKQMTDAMAQFKRAQDSMTRFAALLTMEAQNGVPE